jgi:hypothetical protein
MNTLWFSADTLQAVKAERDKLVRESPIAVSTVRSKDGGEGSSVTSGSSSKRGMSMVEMVRASPPWRQVVAP